MVFLMWYFIFCTQKTAYEMRISDWSSDVCSSDLGDNVALSPPIHFAAAAAADLTVESIIVPEGAVPGERSEEHTSEVQSLMRISYAVFCLKKKKNINISQDIPYKYNDGTNINTHRQSTIKYKLRKTLTNIY